MEKIKVAKKTFDRVAWMNQVNANKTKKCIADAARKQSVSMKELWRKWKNEDSEVRRKIDRKISATQLERKNNIPPRAKRDSQEKRTKSMQRYYSQDTLEVKEQKEFNGHIGRRNKLYCTPAKKKVIMANMKKAGKLRKIKMQKEGEEPQERSSKASCEVQRKRRLKKKLFYEKDVPRKKTYCGVITEKEMRQIND